MKKYVLIFSGIFAFLSLLIVTNPNLIIHKSLLKERLRSLTSKKNNVDDSSFEKGLGLLIGGFVTDKLIDEFVTVDNYLVFSLTKANFDGSSKVIGVGVLGNVYFSKSLNEKMENAFANKNDEGKIESQTKVIKEDEPNSAPERRDFVFIYKNTKTNEVREFKTSELSNVTEDWEYVDRRDIILN
jgi:hypothetical protein